MNSKKRNNVKQNVKPISAEDVAELFLRRELVKTSQWIVFSLKNKFSTNQDLFDLLDTLRIEIRTYREDYYQDSGFKDSCFLFIWEIVTSALATDASRFNKLTEDLIPVMERTIQTNQVLEDIVKVAEKLENKPKYYMTCFYFLILMEGSFKNVLKNLLAMKRISEGKDVSITETLGIQIGESFEKEKAFLNTLPDKFSHGIHSNLRNSIAHGNFKYYDMDDKIEFWDLFPNTQRYSLKPTKLTFKEFSNSLIEVTLFCEIFGFINMILIAIDDIKKRRRFK
ncbi:MAG: hypothetical protein ACBZ72_08805 [Candidatus Bathyarchaeia archaeon]